MSNDKKSLLIELSNIEHEIKVYSYTVDGMSDVLGDDFILSKTEDLLKKVKRMIEIKNILRNNFGINI